MSETDILPVETQQQNAEYFEDEALQAEIQETPEANPAKRGWSRKRKVVATFAATAALLGVQNRELIHAAYNYWTYEPPAHDWDIIPEKTGCELADSDELRAYEAFTPETEDGTEPEPPAGDSSFISGFGGATAARSFSVRQQNEFMSKERLFWLGDNYFDTKAYVHHSERLSMDFELWTHEGDSPYIFNPSAFEQIADDILSLAEVHRHPHVRQLVDCYANRYAEGFGAGRAPVTLGIIADTDKCLAGNNVATLFPEQSTKDCHTSGLGSPEASFHIGPLSPLDERFLIVTPANWTWDNFERTLNTRMLHELIHIIFFDDLSDFFAEQDEQERFVDYMTTSLKMHYAAHGGLPKVIAINEPLSCPEGTDASCVRVEP